jgi:hypothetical protein
MKSEPARMDWDGIGPYPLIHYVSEWLRSTGYFNPRGNAEMEEQLELIPQARHRDYTKRKRCRCGKLICNRARTCRQCRFEGRRRARRRKQ